MPSTQTDRLKGLTTAVAVKAPVLVGSTANLTLSATQTIDGVAVSAGDRVLVKDQTTSSENGIYVADTGDWSRAADFDGSRDVVQGTVTYINSGTANADKWYGVSSTGNNIPGTDTITFTLFAGLAVSGTLDGVLDTSGFAINESEGTFVVVDSTTDIWATDGNTLHITSSGSTISSFGEAPRAGAIRRVIFDAVNIIAHSTTLIELPSSANITTVAGDALTLFADSTTIIRVVNYEPKDGRDISAVETVSTGGAFMRNSGLTIVGSGATSDMAALQLRDPVVGSRKEVFFQTTANALTLDTTSTTTLFSFPSPANIIGSTELTLVGTSLYGVSITLRGVTTALWSVSANSTMVST